jgi:hypothetical protein
MAESQRQEQLAAQLDARQMDLAAAESQIHQLRSETDRVREEQATIVAQLERQQQQQREELSQQSAELRDAQAARQLLGAQLDEERASREKTLQRLSAVERALKAAEDRLIESNSQHESTIKRTAAELDKARATLGEKEAEISSLRQSLLQPAASATLSPREPGDQSTLTVAAASAAATAAAQAEFDRWRMEWMEKYRLVEQENLRLRDRSIRAERMLVDLQRQSGLDGNEMLAPTTMTGAGGGIPRTASQWMSGVTQLPWLESKEEDYLDSFAMGDIETAQQRTRRLAGNSAGASGLRIISVRRLKFMIRTAFREALRQVDVWSVQCGYWLRRQPLGRLLLVFYFVSIHLYLIIYGLSGSPTANLTAAAVAHPS